MKKVGVAYGDALLEYSFGIDHPMNFYRIKHFYKVFEKTFIESSKMDEILLIQPVIADESIIHLFHTKEYVDFVKKASVSGYGYLDYGDTPAFKGVFEASSYVVGTTIECAEQIIKGNVRFAFNPMGGLHHARRDSAAGFCVFNDIGVLIEYLRKKYSIKRFLYVDVDAHHGDGVFYEFYNDKDVLIVDVHENPRTLYPGTGYEDEVGEGEAVGTKMNIVLAAGSDDTIFYKKFDKIKDFIMNSSPDFIILQSGGDALKGDPITHLRLTPKVHYDVALLLKEYAKSVGCLGPLALGGGGYNNISTSQGWINVINAFLQD
ncbi:MAG: acetoin utilization protein AcuC [Nitrososphaeria archaeon]|nr:acetoin utilization protein AcuC [Nitrososphaeria archaeon]